jgi:hypothetical protein
MDHAQLDAGPDAILVQCQPIRAGAAQLTLAFLKKLLLLRTGICESLARHTKH